MPPDAPQKPAALADYLAAERTFLAWIRTGLALMGFGFVVARFGLFLQQLHFLQGQLATDTSGSLWFGTLLIAVGIFTTAFAGWRHLSLVRALDRGEKSCFQPTLQLVAIAFFLALAGAAMAIYLVTLHNPVQNQSEHAKEIPMTLSNGNGIVQVASSHSVEQTVEKVKGILQAKGVMLFALVDHSGEAAKVGMTMRPTKLLIFGSPKAGTPLMQAAPSIAIDLPLKILVAEDDQGKVWISYNSPEYLQHRHNLPADLLQNIAVVKTLAEKAGE
jgi:uncharacterized protein (DUF302 family)/uncharacterized membrane protein YidH (DUF202 family)